MKTASAQNDNSRHIAHRHHPIRAALGMITLAGAITAVIIAASVEIVGGLVTSTGPSAMTHLIAAMLAIPIGYAVAMTLAVGELARGMDSMFTRITSEVQLVRAHAAQAAEAQFISEQQAATPPSVPAGTSAMLSGVLQGVEHEQDAMPVQMLQSASLQ